MKTREFFVDTKPTLAGYISDIHSTKQSLEIEGEKLEKIVDLLRNVLTPHQCAQVVLFCEKNKYKEEMLLWSERNLINSSEWQEFSEPPTRKQVKQ